MSSTAPNTPSPLRLDVFHPERAAYRWLQLLNRVSPLCPFDVETTMHLFRKTRHNLHCCFECDTDQWCKTGLDTHLSLLLIYVLKYWGNSDDPETRRTIRFMRGMFLGQFTNTMYNRLELETIELVAPVMNEIHDMHAGQL